MDVLGFEGRGIQSKYASEGHSTFPDWRLASAGRLVCCGIACGASGREATGSLFFAGPSTV
ncbi:hypothetical protein, partial [Dyella acidisoli]|uniref:hypothetical protein n=1 Tax=Dyella acidisoli TaxID=1867834 RepID=UPI0024E14EA9